MRYRQLGRTGLRVSEIGFGCGNVGGLVIRGEPAERTRGVARALELGINYFDTAASYGNGQSEINLGAALRELGANAYVGTKVNAPARAGEDIRGGVVKSVERSLRRLGRDSVDLIQLHNQIGVGRGEMIGAEDVLVEVLEAFQVLQRDGKVRFCGITGFGETGAIHQVIGDGELFTVQTCYNLLNPSAAQPVPEGFYAQDFGGLMLRASERGMGVIVIRVLAGGALSGAVDRHPVASGAPAPMGTSAEYGEDVTRAQELRFLLEQGYAADLVEASLRFALGRPEVSTVLVGYSSIEQVEHAAASAEKGPLPGPALERLPAAWGRM